MCDSFTMGWWDTKEEGGDILKLSLLRTEPRAFQEGKPVGIKARRPHTPNPVLFFAAISLRMFPLFFYARISGI